MVVGWVVWKLELRSFVKRKRRKEKLDKGLYQGLALRDSWKLEIYIVSVYSNLTD